MVCTCFFPRIWARVIIVWSRSELKGWCNKIECDGSEIVCEVVRALEESSLSLCCQCKACVVATVLSSHARVFLYVPVVGKALHHCARNRIGQRRRGLEAGEVEPRRHSGTGPSEGHGDVPRRTGGQSQRAGGKHMACTSWCAVRTRDGRCVYQKPGIHVENAVLVIIYQSTNCIETVVATWFYCPLAPPLPPLPPPKKKHWNELVAFSPSSINLNKLLLFHSPHKYHTVTET